MFTIVGILVVIGAVVGGYLMEHGNLKVLVQPAELVIIGGAALGTLFIANPLPIVMKIFKGILSPFLPSRFSKKSYLETLRMLNELFGFARKNGSVQLESHIEDPHKSALFTKYPHFIKDHHAVFFVCDTLRMSVSGGIAPFELEQMMELDIEVHHHELEVPVAALTTVADSLPGLGIVAAVLGVVITMGALGGPPEEIGHKVAAALVGTFLGILVAYGFCGPLSAAMEHRAHEEGKAFEVVKMALVASVRGYAPPVAIEFARKLLFADVRPTFADLENHLKGKKKEAAAA